jgi:hypothetical protein
MFSVEIEGCGEVSSPKNEPDPDRRNVFSSAVVTCFRKLP